MLILHLEYSDFFRRVLKDMIIQSGHSVIESKKGGDIFKLLAQNPVDMIITGLELSDMLGEEVIEELNESQFGDLPIVVITGLDIIDLKERIKGLKINDFILKQDLDLHSFQRVVDRLLP